VTVSQATSATTVTCFHHPHLIDVYEAGTGLSDRQAREWFVRGDVRLDASEALARHFIDDVGDRYHAQAVAERFAAGRPPLSGRMVVKALKPHRTAGRRR